MSLRCLGEEQGGSEPAPASQLTTTEAKELGPGHAGSIITPE